MNISNGGSKCQVFERIKIVDKEREEEHNSKRVRMNGKIKGREQISLQDH